MKVVFLGFCSLILSCQYSERLAIVQNTVTSQAVDTGVKESANVWVAESDGAQLPAVDAEES